MITAPFTNHVFSPPCGTFKEHCRTLWGDNARAEVLSLWPMLKSQGWGWGLGFWSPLSHAPHAHDSPEKQGSAHLVALIHGCHLPWLC